MLTLTSQYAYESIGESERLCRWAQDHSRADALQRSNAVRRLNRLEEALRGQS